MPGIFVSYRREDSAAHAGRLADQLSLRLGPGIFMDVDSIPAGEDFVQYIQGRLASSEIVLVVMGRHWLNATDAGGRRRIDDPNDIVSMEIAMALSRNLRVIPVLVGGATMPAGEELPAALRSLCRRNALEISDARFHDDVKQLIRVIESRQELQSSRPHVKYKRAIQVLCGLQTLGAWAAFVLSITRTGGDDGQLMVWVLLWISGGILIELSRRSKLLAGIFLGATVPLTLIAEVALEHPTHYSGALGYSHWQILRGLGLVSALISSYFGWQVFNGLSDRPRSIPTLPLVVLLVLALLWLLSRYF